MQMRNVSSRWIFTLLFILFTAQGCIKEDTKDCGEEALLLLTVVDLLNGLDITEEDEVGDVDLFIFDPTENYIDRVTVPNDKLKAGDPILIRHTDTRGLWISAWGNLKDGQLIPLLKNGSRLTEENIRLVEDEEGFSTSPDDLFFGIRQINLDEVTRAVTIIREELPIYRKNGSLYITVIGLPDNAAEEEHFFCISGNYYGYNFKGEPMSGKCNIKQAGKLNANKQYITTEAIRVIHGISEEDQVQVDLCKSSSTTRTHTIIASATEDDAGNPIIPRSGETTNVLIDLRGTSMSVQVMSTPWNEIYNWMTW